MKFKKILSFITIVGLGSTIFSSNAFAATAVLDNDALSSAPGHTSSSGSWTYKSGSGYNSDHRYANAGSGSFQYSGYIWGYNVKNVSGTYGVYLNSASFTNTSTAYQIGESGGYVYINQKSAPGGWSTLKTYKGYNHLTAINGSLTTKSGGVGADATRLVY